MIKAIVFAVMILWFAASVPAGWVDTISIVVGVAITLALKLGPIPSRVVAGVGFVAGLFGAFGATIINMFPEGSRVPLYIAVFGVVIVAISERLQGGITIPEKRKEAVVAEQQGTTF